MKRNKEKGMAFLGLLLGMFFILWVLAYMFRLSQLAEAEDVVESVCYQDVLWVKIRTEEDGDAFLLTRDGEAIPCETSELVKTLAESIGIED